MAARGTVLAELVVSDDEREILERWARRPTTAQALALRCRIVLACAEGLSNVEVADRLGVSRMTVGKWRSRFVSDRLDGLHDEPRPGGPRSIGDDDVERVIVKTLEETPRDVTDGRLVRWPRRRACRNRRSVGSGGLRAQAAPCRHLQAVTGPALHRQGP